VPAGLSVSGFLEFWRLLVWADVWGMWEVVLVVVFVEDTVKLNGK
jgi:hypothetical protein